MNRNEIIFMYLLSPESYEIQLNMSTKSGSDFHYICFLEVVEDPFEAILDISSTNSPLTTLYKDGQKA